MAATCPASNGTDLATDLADVSCTAITLAPGTYASATGFTSPMRAITIFGPGAGLADIKTTGPGDVLTVQVPPGGMPPNAFTLSGVTVHGATSGAGVNVTGAGITNLSNVIISGNTSTANGAGITFSGGTLNVSNSIITSNSTSGNGGGFENSGIIGPATFSQVLFVANSSTGSGGGGAFDTATLGTVTNFKNVTFTGNHADADGGAVRSGLAGATTNLNNVTIANNAANNDMSGGGTGGGLSNSGGTINIGNSIVANDLAFGGGAPDCAGTITRTGYELIRDPTGCTLAGAATGYLTGVDPMLGALDSNGGLLANDGPMQTMALLVGSPAVNAGNPATPTGSSGTCETIDQRSRPRTTSSGALPCDLGAFEAQPATCNSIFETIGIGQATPITLSCSGDPFVYNIVSPPSHGTLTGFDNLTGDVTYTPNGGFTGTDSFTYDAKNGPLESTPLSVTFSVKGPTPLTPSVPPPSTSAPFDLKAAIRKCKRRVPKGPKRTKCIKKAKKRARNLGQ
jgi:predicted outer membrane repeat protein